MSSFNIIVDLSEFFQDERKVAYVYVDENYDHIIDLEKRICNIFSINKKICLTKEGVLLPSCESIFLLQNQDCITAVAVSDEFHINIPKTSRPERDIKIVDVIPISQFNDNNNIKPPQAKKTKKSSTSCNNLPKQQPAAGGSGDGVGVDTQEHAISQSKLQISKDISLCTTPGLTTAAKSFPEKELPVLTVEEIVCRSSLVQEREQPSFVTKRKRKRTRNRSAKNIPDNSGIRESMFCSTPLHQQTATVTKTSSNHIRFDQPSSPATKDVESVCNKTTEAFHIIKPRIIPAMTPCVGESRRNGAGFDGNTKDSALNISNDTSTLTNINKTMGPDEIKYLWDNFKTDDHPPMKTLPDENDVIAFKMYKMTDMYEPYISEHIFALVVSIIDDKVELQLLAGHESKKKQVGKFDLPPEDNETIDVDTSESSITMAWKDIIEPRKMC